MDVVPNIPPTFLEISSFATRRTFVMVDVTCELLLCLPTVLSCEILSAWLDVSDLVRTDSAFCNHKSRTRLHALYRRPELICFLRRFREQFRWFMDRQIKLEYLDITLGLPEGVLLGYLRHCGRFIRSIWLSTGSSSILIKRLATYCPNVTSLAISKITHETLELVNASRRLHSLEVYLSHSFVGYELHTGDLKESRGLQKLRTSCTYTDAAVMVKLVDKYPCLTHFSPHCRGPVPGVSVVSMISRLSQLVALNLSGLFVIDATLIAIVQSCLCIVHLDLHGCSRITDTGMYTVATTLKL